MSTLRSNSLAVRSGNRLHSALTFAAALVITTCAAAQAPRPGGPPPPPPPPPSATGSSSTAPSALPPPPPHPGQAIAGAPDKNGQPAGVQLGPGGRWWDDKRAARSLNLTDNQQKNMDAAFNAVKQQLYGTYTSLKQQEATLKKLQKSDSPDEKQIMAQIDRVTALRGDLQKQAAALALQLRSQLTPEQIKKLQSQ
jgi:Spy/CpxP family protein refolding chaperone